MPATFPPTPLFHYTSMPDLKALLASQSITLTPLDTSSELNAALSFIQGTIINAYPQLSTDYFNLNNISGFPIFSYSLTGQKDSAALWQNFSPDGGFAFTINATQLSAAMSANSLILAQCLYDDAVKTDFIINTIVASTPDELDLQSPMFQKRIRWINRNIMNYASILKDSSRAGEQEWKIIAEYYLSQELLGGPTDPPDPLSHPVLNGSSGPYVAVPLISGSYTTTGIEQIVIGPHADMAQAMTDCQALLAGYGLTNVTITESSVPYQ